MKKVLLTVVSAVSFMAAGSVMAGDAGAGKTAYAAKGCAGCHGAAGHSAVPNYPNLVGQHAAYVTKQLKAFKAGTRSDPTMAAMVAALTPADIDNIAAYLATTK